MKDTYNIGIIGYGGFGRFLHHHWARLDGIEIAAVADQRSIDADPGIRVFSDWNKLIRAPDIDIISIATPPNTHSDMACAAMHAGKHVLIEKPLALSLQDAQRVIDTRNQSNCIATVDYMLRFNPVVRALRAITNDGTLGELRQVAVENLAQDNGLPDAHWFWDKSVSGGIFIEHGVHFFDLVRHISRQGHAQVRAVSDRRNVYREDEVCAVVKHSGGLISSHFHAFTRTGFFEKTTIRLIYDLADIEVYGWIPLSGRISALVSDKTRQKLGVLPGFKIARSRPVREIPDDSRPEGWGEGISSREAVISRGIPYEAGLWIEGTFAIGKTKGDVYGECVQAVLLDLIRAVEDPGHDLCIPLEDAFDSLEIAIRADRAAGT